jgi:hypothetical protein
MVSWSMTGDPESAADLRAGNSLTSSAGALSNRAARRGQGLGHGADVGHAPRVEALDRADRGPVIAELGVVVVLDHQVMARQSDAQSQLPRPDQASSAACTFSRAVSSVNGGNGGRWATASSSAATRDVSEPSVQPTGARWLVLR